MDKQLISMTKERVVEIINEIKSLTKGYNRIIKIRPEAYIITGINSFNTIDLINSSKHVNVIYGNKVPRMTYWSKHVDIITNHHYCLSKKTITTDDAVIIHTLVYMNVVNEQSESYDNEVVINPKLTIYMKELDTELIDLLKQIFHVTVFEDVKYIAFYSPN